MGKDLLQVCDTVAEDDVQILCPDRLGRARNAAAQVPGSYLPLPDEEDQHVAEAEEIETVGIERVVIVVVEVDPAAAAALAVDEEMIAPDVAVLFAAIVKKGDGLRHLQKGVKKCGKVLMVVGLVIPTYFPDEFG